MSDVDLRGKRVLVRVDFNVPIHDGRISDDTRIRAVLPGVRQALAQGARVMLASHLGRPAEGEFNEKDSLAPVARRLSELLGQEVPLKRDWLEGVTVAPGSAVLLENCRFNRGEKKDDDALAKKMAALCDVYVNDAFGTAHRAEASTHAIAKYAPMACAGPLMAAEIEALSKALERPARPLVAIVAGAKVSTKLSVLAALAGKVDRLIPGGGIANTFMLAAGMKIGKSLAEPELAAEAKRIAGILRAKGAEVPLPTDVVCAKEITETARAENRGIAGVFARGRRGDARRNRQVRGCGRDFLHLDRRRCFSRIPRRQEAARDRNPGAARGRLRARGYLAARVSIPAARASSRCTRDTRSTSPLAAKRS